MPSTPSSPTTGADNRPVKTFSNAVSQEIFPTKDQAIIFQHIPGTNATYYAEKMSAKIGVENILHCGVISEQRVRMYLKSADLAKQFLETDGTLEIDRKIIRARPYMTKNKKIIISNVPPHVPHDVILNVITAHGAVPATKMNFLHLTMQTNLRSVLSERRSVFITEDTANKLPPSVLINYEEDQYRIFFNDTKIKCFICHEFGHTSNQCQYSYENAAKNSDASTIQTENNDDSKVSNVTISEIPEDESNENKLTKTVPDNEPANKPEEQNVNVQTPSDNFEPSHESLFSELLEQTQPVNLTKSSEIEIPSTSQSQVMKRPLSIYSESSISSINTDISQTQNPSLNPKQLETNEINPTLKVIKTSDSKKMKAEDEPISIKEQLKSIEENFKLHEKEYPISFSNFLVMMDMLKGQSDPMSTITQFTNDMDGVVKILNQNYPHLDTRTMKTRFTKLRKKISKDNVQKMETDGDSTSE
ncbi:unnamed protein product [Allacma fusca]|uniref:Uncharacterized protein n=1 Tax=Allacma fusca TaxID=39272 RepID=A0A8J2P3S9_9HEXA|nr:unnamed protein product [Allacma fusca]